jgi:preprotein translocase subunit SecG
MTELPMLAVGILMNLVAVLFVIVCIVLVLVILVQKGRGGGLSAAFGGGMAGSLLGSKTGDFLTWVTIVLVGVFLLLAVVLARFYRPSEPHYGADAEVTNQQQQQTSSPGPATDQDLGATGDMGAEPEATPAEPIAQPEMGEPGPTMPAEPNASGG